MPSSWQWYIYYKYELLSEKSHHFLGGGTFWTEEIKYHDYRCWHVAFNRGDSIEDKCTCDYIKEWDSAREKWKNAFDKTHPPRT